MYLSKFATEPKAYEVHFYVGEIDFFRLERNFDAATHYMAAAKGIPEGDDGPAARPCATTRSTTRSSPSRARWTSSAEAGQAAPSTSEAANKYAEALDLYAQFYPNDPELPAMFYRQGQYYFDNGNYDSAVKIWGMLLEKFPNSEQARDAGDSILESFNRAKNYENIETWARRLKALPSFAAAKQQEQLDALIVRAVFKQGEQKAAAGDHAGGGGGVPARGQGVPARTPRAAQACVNAEQEAKLAGDAKTLQEAAQLAMGPAVPRPAGVADGRVDRDDDAAGDGPLRRSGRPRRADGGPRRPRAPELRASSSTRRTRPTTRSSCARPPASTTARWPTATSSSPRTARAPEADEVVFQMGRAHQNAGRAKDAAELYKRYLARAKNLDHRAQGLVLLAQAQLKIGDERGAAGVARRGGDPRQAPGARARRRGQVRRGARPLHAGRARRSRSSSRSRSRAT